MASQGVVDPQSIVLCTPVPWPYRASMDNAPLDEPRVPAALVLLTELDLPVAPLADRVGHALDLLRDRERTPALLEECRTLSLGLATTWRWDREDTFPDGRAIGVALLAEVRARVEG